MVTGLLERFPTGQSAGAAPNVVRIRGQLEGRGVSLTRIDRESGQHVPVLDGYVSADGATFSGTIELCGEFSLRKTTPRPDGALPNQPLQSDGAAARAAG